MEASLRQPAVPATCLTATSAGGAPDVQTASILAVDVGAGTSDILLTIPGEPLANAVKLVVPSATRVVAARIAGATARGQTVVFRGPVMGGGACGGAMKAHVRAGLAFVATATAASTFADDLDRVRALGVRIVEDGAADEELRRLPAATTVDLRSGDLDVPALREALARLGVEPTFAAAAIAVQDHGYCPDGSNRVFRFRLWERAVRERRAIGELFYAADPPPELTRLRAAAAAAASAADGPVMVADTGPAALYGALPRGVDDAVLINVGNGHTVCLLALGGRVAGVFEHHTRALDGPGLEARLRRWLAADLHSDEVRADHGHGAIIDPAAARTTLPDVPFIVTGPQRHLLAGCRLPLELAAPHGDMMLTGCFGLLRALGERCDMTGCAA